MRSTPQIKNNPEQLIPYAYNNFRAATLAGAYYVVRIIQIKTNQHFLNLSKDYIHLEIFFPAVFKFGAKYKSKSRTNNQTQILCLLLS